MSLNFTHLLFICKNCDTEVKAKIGQVVKNCPVCGELFADESDCYYQSALPKMLQSLNSKNSVDISLVKEQHKQWQCIF